MFFTLLPINLYVVSHCIVHNQTQNKRIYMNPNSSQKIGMTLGTAMGCNDRVTDVLKKNRILVYTSVVVSLNIPTMLCSLHTLHGNYSFHEYIFFRSWKL